ncbi:fungal-specific transcription factor domain-containing protein [Aspergillus pseudodeflectus]|uniref:Fungal-specific transcription factor domain-containing protein n=1 Tax=Aspergillus pseudodeflectus TaxID=176178 RepID=A0ABR4K162_9EURO
MVNRAEAPSRVSQPHQSTPPLPRARVACKACNARRVKCDAGPGQPCWHCRMRNSPCELIESRRGKYVRRKKAARLDQQVHEQPQEPASESPGPVACTTESLGALNNQQEGHPALLATTADAQSTTEDQLSPALPDSARGSLEESTGLTYTIEVDYTPTDGPTERLKVHYPIPAAVADRSTFSQAHSAGEAVSLIHPLFTPSRHVADALIYAFFTIIHPAYPVYDRKSFMQSYLEGNASALVLQTIFFVGFTVCPDTIIQESGYSDRTTARKTHYLHAKRLYDSDHEQDPLKGVASLLLFGFWWFGPEDQKDTCYWVGCATNVAQGLRMHRASPCGMRQEDRSLRKRIWWSIYTRDRHTAAAFGRPCRIRDEDCDIEPLTEEDFQFDSDCGQTLIPAQRDFHVSYVIEMSKLAVILGDILIGDFSPRRPALEKFETRTLADRLAEWEAHLPDTLRRPTPDGSLGATFWATMLYISYHNYHILLFRPKSIEIISSTEIERDARARTAADSLTRLAEDLLATGTIRSGQIHLVPAFFGALSVHTIVMCRKDRIRQKLAENKSRQCLLALSELSHSWPVRIWFARALVNLMRRLTGRGESIVSISSSIERDNRDLAEPGPRRSPCPSRQAAPIFFLDHAYNAHIHDHPAQMPEPLIYDSVLAGYLDNTFDPDLQLYNSLEPLLPLSVEDFTTYPSGHSS